MKTHIRFRRLFVEALELRQMLAADISFDRGNALWQPPDHDHPPRYSSLVSTSRAWQTWDSNHGRGRDARLAEPGAPRVIVDREFNPRGRGWEGVGIGNASDSSRLGSDRLTTGLDWHRSDDRQRALRSGPDRLGNAGLAPSSLKASPPVNFDQAFQPVSRPFESTFPVVTAPQFTRPTVVSNRVTTIETISFPITSFSTNLTSNEASSTLRVSAIGPVKASSTGSLEAARIAALPMSPSQESITNESGNARSLQTLAGEVDSAADLGWKNQIANSQLNSNNLIDLTQPSSTLAYDERLIGISNLKLDLLTQPEDDEALKPRILARATLKNLQKLADRQAGFPQMQQPDATVHDLTIDNWFKSQDGLIELLGRREPVSMTHQATNTTQVVVQLDSIMGLYRFVDMMHAGTGSELEFNAINSTEIPMESTESVFQGQFDDEQIRNIGPKDEAVAKVELSYRSLLDPSIFLTTLLTYFFCRKHKKRNPNLRQQG